MVFRRLSCRACQQKRAISPLEALFGSRSGLFEDFLGSDFFRIGEESAPAAAAADEVDDAPFGEPASTASGMPRRRGSGLASRISEHSEALLQEAAKHAADFGRSEVDTEHLLLALADSDVIKTILSQFKIKVDDLKRQIEAEAKRGDKPFEGEIGVSPRVKDALSRAFVASNELGHSYVGREHFLIGLAEEGEGLAANLLRRYGLTPQALRQQVNKVVGKGAEDGRAETPTNTPELDKYSRDLTKMAHAGKLDPVIGRAQEIETTIEVLARRKKNNPVLIGEPGVGKTAIVEGLAQRMVAGEVRDAARQAPGGAEHQFHGGRREVPWRVRGAGAEGAEGDLRAPGRDDPLHRRGAHHRRCRPGRRRRRVGCGQRLRR